MSSVMQLPTQNTPRERLSPPWMSSTLWRDKAGRCTDSVVNSLTTPKPIRLFLEPPNHTEISKTKRYNWVNVCMMCVLWSVVQSLIQPKYISLEYARLSPVTAPVHLFHVLFYRISKAASVLVSKWLGDRLQVLIHCTLHRNSAWSRLICFTIWKFICRESYRQISITSIASHRSY